MLPKIASVLALALVGVASSSAQVVFTNAGFEAPAVDGLTTITPDGWNYFDSGQPRTNGLTDTAAFAGDQSLYFTTATSNGANFYAGYVQNHSLSLAAGQDISFNAYIRSDVVSAFSGDAFAVLGMEFRNGGSETNRVELALTPVQLSSGWTLYTVTGSAISAVNNVNFTILLKTSGAFTASSGTFYVDNVSFGAVAVPEPAAAAAFAGVAALGAVTMLRRRRAIRA